MPLVFICSCYYLLIYVLISSCMLTCWFLDLQASRSSSAPNILRIASAIAKSVHICTQSTESAPVSVWNPTRLISGDMAHGAASTCDACNRAHSGCKRFPSPFPEYIRFHLPVRPATGSHVWNVASQGDEVVWETLIRILVVSNSHRIKPIVK